MSKLRLTIGEFSKLCYVTVKTLRHYEKIGLLAPSEVDAWTGYRYYDVGQTDEMIRIRRLKALGLSLEEIKEMTEDGLQTPDLRTIEQKIRETEESLCRLRQRLAALQMLREPTITSEKMNGITIKPLPGGTVASWRKHLKSYDGLGPSLMNEVLPEMQRLQCVCPEETAYCFTVDYNSNQNPEDIDLEYCEIVSSHSDLPSEIITFRELPLVETAVCINHFGSYSTFGETMSAALHYIEDHGRTIASQPRFNYIHGIWDCDNVSEWLTEIQIPII